jgi:hypothetical protein
VHDDAARIWQFPPFSIFATIQNEYLRQKPIFFAKLHSRYSPNCFPPFVRQIFALVLAGTSAIVSVGIRPPTIHRKTTT